MRPPACREAHHPLPAWDWSLTPQIVWPPMRKNYSLSPVLPPALEARGQGGQERAEEGSLGLPSWGSRGKKDLSHS